MREAFDIFVSILEHAGCKPRGNGLSRTAECPSHKDSSPSLSVRCGATGRVLVHCFAGCSTQSVLDALGADWKVLFADDGWADDGGVLHYYKPDRESLAILNDVLGPALNEPSAERPAAPRQATSRPHIKPRRFGVRW